MSCKIKKRKISDLLDKRLSEKQVSILENHILQCPSCREYRNQLILISSKVREREKKGMPKEYALEFSERLKRQLLNGQRRKGQTKRFSGFEKWAYSAVGFIVVLFLLVYFIVFQPTSIPTEGYFVLSFEDALGGLVGEIQDNEELEELFNSILLTSFTEALEGLDKEFIPFIIENPIYHENLSEEDIKSNESKIKQKLKLELDEDGEL